MPWRIFKPPTQFSKATVSDSIKNNELNVEFMLSVTRPRNCEIVA
jgi:hypothetical protein